MGIRAAHSDGTAVRWTHGALLALCLVLAVLAHHEICDSGTSPSMAGASRAGHPAMAVVHQTASTPDTDGMGETADHAAPSVSDTPSHGGDLGGCDAPGVQHCGSGSLSSVQLAVPSQSAPAPPTDLPHVSAVSTPGTPIERAPPDLSVLSTLRI